MENVVAKLVGKYPDVAESVLLLLKVSYDYDVSTKDIESNQNIMGYDYSLAKLYVKLINVTSIYDSENLTYSREALDFFYDSYINHTDNSYLIYKPPTPFTSEVLDLKYQIETPSDISQAISLIEKYKRDGEVLTKACR